MFTVLVILLAAVALLAIAYPILAGSRNTQPVSTTGQERLDELLAQRDTTFQALRDLNFDRQVGKVTDDDFHAFEAGLKQIAAESLRALDEWEAQATRDLDAKLSAEVQARRRARTTRASAGAGACPQCGAALKAGDRFCARCGAETATPAKAAAVTPARTCRNCDAVLEPGDTFCARCGTPAGKPSATATLKTRQSA